jgi:hypothetical protein
MAIVECSWAVSHGIMALISTVSETVYSAHTHCLYIQHGDWYHLSGVLREQLMESHGQPTQSILYNLGYLGCHML